MFNPTLFSAAARSRKIAQSVAQKEREITALNARKISEDGYLRVTERGYDFDNRDPDRLLPTVTGSRPHIDDARIAQAQFKRRSEAAKAAWARRRESAK